MLVAVERGFIRTMSGQNPSRRTIAEPRLGLLALVAALVVVLAWSRSPTPTTSGSSL
jgi:hypothetical protein